MAEFKKLSAVEAVASVSDTASVLIEEDGVIKRAPKSEVGGVKVASTAEIGQAIIVKAVDESGNPTEWECANMAKGEEPDMVITISNSMSALPTEDDVVVTKGSVQEIATKLHAYEIPDVRIRWEYTSNNYVYEYVELAVPCTFYGEWVFVSCMYMNPNNWDDTYCLGIGFVAETGSISSITRKKITVTNA